MSTQQSAKIQALDNTMMENPIKFIKMENTLIRNTKILDADI